jgi:hypothetical protein
MSSRDIPTYTREENAKNLDIATGVFGGLSGLSAVYAGYKKYQVNRLKAQIGVGDNAGLNDMDIYLTDRQIFGGGVRGATILGGIAVLLSAAKDGEVTPLNASSRRKEQLATGIIGKILLAAGPNIITLGAYNDVGIVISTRLQAAGMAITVAGLALIGVSQDVGNVVGWDGTSDKALVFH